MSFVDERIVKMVFDNSEFAQKVSGTINSITQLNKATDDVGKNGGKGITSLSEAFGKAEITATQAGFHIRDVWLKVASILEYQIAGKIVNVGKQIANAMTIEGITDGFKEYELKMGSVQTIMAGTGESLQTVNKYLEELNKYSDQTIYSFADMTNNIGKFTNAGVKLEDAVAAIKGIANEAAISGANANEASRAMYNFSQALSAGYVKLIDWKSIENANMATLGFKETLLEVASTCGTVEKDADGMYKVLTTNAQGKTMDDLVSGTKNFNDSLQQQWMTTEVLTKALKIYATDVRTLSEEERKAYEEEMRAMGMTEEQIKHFEELGSKATDAASEIKTFSMLIDTLKEAIGSGWAMTWELLIGDFEEAKELWTAVGNVLGGIIDKSSDARNELIKGWKAIGGRQDVLDGLKNVFEFLVKVIKPIGEAMREIFPPTTRAQLYNISHGFKEFTESLRVTSVTATNIRNIARGLFSVLDIGVKAVKAFVNAFLPSGKGIGDFGTSLLEAAANLGKLITKFDQTITKNKTFEKIFTGLANVIKPVFSFILTTATNVIKLLGTFFGGFIEGSGKVSTAGNTMQKVFDNISGGIDNIKKRFEGLRSIFDGVASVLKGVGSVLGAIFKQIGDSLTGFSSGGNAATGIVTIFNAILSGGIMYTLYSGVKKLSSITDSFTGILDGLGKALDSFGKNIGSETLLNTAKAIALLAASLLLVASIDSNKLAGATAAITGLMAGLAGSMALLMKAVQTFGKTNITKSFTVFGKEIFGSDVTKMLEMAVTLQAVSKALVSMGIAVLAMAAALKLVASVAEGGHLWDSFAVVSLMLAELTGVAILLGKYGQKSKKAAKDLINMSEALLLMAVALKLVASTVEQGNALEALGIISIMLAELTGVVLLISNFSKYKMSGLTSLISMAASLNLCVIALKSVSDALGNEGNHIWESLGLISVMLLELAGITILMSKFAGFAALGGAGAILAATSLVILVQALKQINTLLSGTNNHVWQALAVIGAALLVLAVGLTAMVATLPGAAAALVASAALVVLGGALKIIGSMKLSEIGKALLALAGSLVVLAAGLTAMIIALPGAAALTVASVGITALAGALKLLGSMSIGELTKSILALAVAMAGIAIIGTIFSAATLPIIAFSAAIITFSVAIAAAGVALTVFSAGLTALAGAISMIFPAFAKLGSEIKTGFNKALNLATKTINDKKKDFKESGKNLLQGLIGGLSDNSVLGKVISAAAAVGKAVIGGLNSPAGLNEHSPSVWSFQSGENVDYGVINGMKSASSEVFNTAGNVGGGLIDSLNDPLKSGIEDSKGILGSLTDAIDTSAIPGLENLTDTMNGKVTPSMDTFGKTVNTETAPAVDSLTKVLTSSTKVTGKYTESFERNKKAQEEQAKVIKENTQVVKDLGTETERSEKFLRKHTDSTYINIKAMKTSKEKAMALHEVQQRAKHNQAEYTGTVEDNTEALDQNTKAQEANAKAAGKSGTATKKSADVMDYAKGVVEAFTAKYGHLYTELGEDAPMKVAQLAVRNLAEETYKASLAAEQATDKNKETKASIEDMIKAFTDMKQKVYDAVKSEFEGESFFMDKFEAKTEMTMAKVLENMKSHIDGVTSWAAKMEELGEKGVNQGLLKYLMELGPKGYELVNAFSTATTEEIAQANTMFEQAAALPDQISNNTLASYAKAGLNCVAGFAGGIDKNVATASISMDNLGKTSLKSLESSLEIHSPSRATYRDGEYIVQGLVNGIRAYTSYAVNTCIILCTQIKTTISNNLAVYKFTGYGQAVANGIGNGITYNTYVPVNAASSMCSSIEATISAQLTIDKFRGYGENVAQGLANGLSSGSIVDKVKSAAAKLSAIIDNVTTKYNEIKSPAKRYIRYGKYIAQGLANGLIAGQSYAEESATLLAEAVENSMSLLEDIAESDMEIHPVISPVLDLNGVRSKAGLIGSLLPKQSLAMASSIGIGSAYESSDSNSGSSVATGASINFTQNNYSPKALNRYEIYRDTKNQVSQLKGLLR